MNSKQTLSGGQVRRARRTGKFEMLNRDEQFRLIRGFTTVAQCRDVATDAGLSNRLRRQALRQAIHLGLLGDYVPVTKVHEVAASVIMDLMTTQENEIMAEDTAFQRLVERFTAEGKPNPEKSARASIAAQKQAAAKRAAKQATA